MDHKQSISTNDEIFIFKKNERTISNINSYYGWEEGYQAMYNYFTGYLNAANIVYKKIEDATKQQRIEIMDTLIYPLIFLYRHAFELNIKYLYLKYSNTTKDEMEKFFSNDHNLIECWNILESIINKNLQEQKSKLKVANIRHYVNQINIFDPKSMCFRYPIDKKLNRVNMHGKILDVEHLKESMERLFEYLKKIDFEIDNKISNIKIDENIITKNNLIILIQKNIEEVKKIEKYMNNHDEYEIKLYLQKIKYSAIIITELFLYTGRDININGMKLSLTDNRKNDFIDLLLYNYHIRGYNLLDKNRKQEYIKTICSKRKDLVIDWLNTCFREFKNI